MPAAVCVMPAELPGEDDAEDLGRIRGFMLNAHSSPCGSRHAAYWFADPDFHVPAQRCQLAR